ncbi:hypothetical protein B0O99DRAFT_611703 [Bisporella sp. PMI_857]|nr:hypothetical protein B0O99DRAFT_611703 [Bisporella sp. PMI_857]
MLALNTLSRYGDEKFRQEAEEGFNAEVNHASSDADKLELLISIRSFSFLFIKSASRRLAPAESEAVQKGLRVFWYMFIQTAKALDKDSPVHDKLVLLLLFTKELDLVHRNLHPTEVAATTWESYGFFDSLQASWQHTLTAGTASQQRNLAAFSSKALATGIWSESLALVTLWYLREALETEDETKTIALLPATVGWFENANFFLLNFSLANKPSQEQSNGNFLSAGALAHKSGIEPRGFSINR